MFLSAAQTLVMFVQEPMGNLLPLGLVMFLIVGAVCLIPACIGAFAGRKLSS
jgi:hypothetical protein